MAVVHCANPECPGSGLGDMQAGLDRAVCLVCGRETDLNGNLLPKQAEFTVPLNTIEQGGVQQGVRKV